MLFADEAFDAVTCLEGIEHVLDPVFLIRELVRITKPGGTIVISTPNTANFYSRLQFLFTGTFFQFDARGMRQTYGNAVDRGHVSPFTPLHLIYVLGAVGCNLVEVRTDRWKRKALLPLRLLMSPFTFLWTRKIARGTAPATYPGVEDIHELLTSFKLKCWSLFGIPMIRFSDDRAGRAHHARRARYALTRAAKSSRYRSVIRWRNVRFSSGGTGV
ncbi:MAG: class I SAM-dependent methyltransferase [Burkholderia gladioli]